MIATGVYVMRARWPGAADRTTGTIALTVSQRERASLGTGDIGYVALPRAQSPSELVRHEPSDARLTCAREDSVRTRLSKSSHTASAWDVAVPACARCPVTVVPNNDSASIRVEPAEKAD